MQGPLRGCQPGLHKIFSQGHKDLYKVMQGPVTKFHKDLRNIFSQGPPQYLGQDLQISLGRTTQSEP